MDDVRDSVMVALLPIVSDWSKLTLPHLTLVYAGQTFDLNPTDHNELLKTAASIAMDFRVFQLFSMGVDVFGEEGDKVDVLRLRPTPDLLQMRRRVEPWNASKFPFNPHVTIGPQGTVAGPFPPAVAFNRIAVAWGEELTNFWLKI